MGVFQIFRKLRQVGPITIGTGLDREGRRSFVAACSARDCGWSAGFETSSAASVAAEGHRCRLR